ncbi:MAG: DUF3224 domain-containing protein [Holophagales bacterium]|nr:DUF3224 domain-containing protein [Holophagales bacterium]
MGGDRWIERGGLDAAGGFRRLARGPGVVFLLSTVVVFVCVLVSVPAPAEASGGSPGGGEEKKTTEDAGDSASTAKEMAMEQAKGTFEVKLEPMQLHDALDDSLLGRMSIDKRFEGELEGTSRGEMLSARTATQGSAGYVAVEKVSATLAGRTGTFVLQHSSTMNRGEPVQSIQVVPDSATGELEGLEGTMVIEIAGGEHRYLLEYRFREP